MWGALGMVLARRCQRQVASAAFRLALLLAPDNAAMYSNLGLTLKEQGALTEALAACDDAIAGDEHVRRVDGIEVQTVREALERGADETSKDLERFYDGILPEISERSLRDHYLRLDEPDPTLAERLRALHDLPEGTLGHAYVEFYRRNNITLPGDDIHLPAHYVNHDMNHVITGYEPTAPGEIARSGFLCAADDSRRNWLEFLITMSIHETGVLTHGDIRAKVATLDRHGVPHLLGEGLERGAQCRVDLSQVDHLALVEMDLDEVRRQFNVVPLAHPMV